MVLLFHFAFLVASSQSGYTSVDSFKEHIKITRNTIHKGVNGYETTYSPNYDNSLCSQIKAWRIAIDEFNISFSDDLHTPIFLAPHSRGADEQYPRTVAGFGSCSNRTNSAGGAEGNFISHVHGGSGASDSTNASIWQQNVYLGAQWSLYTALALQYEITKRRGVNGQSLSIGYSHVLFTLEPENFTRFWVPLQYTYFQGDRHHWEIGGGLLFGRGMAVRNQPTRTLIGRTLFLTWQPIGYRFDDRDSRFKIRIYPYLTMNLYEFDGPLKESQRLGNRDETGTVNLLLCLILGWHF